MEVRFIPQEEIDKVKWNSCVHYAPNGNIFGYMWYLDTVAKEWDALVEGDYEAILPLFTTERPDTLQQPSLIREAGIYSINLLSEKRIKAFLNAIPEQYQSIQLRLNAGIRPPEELNWQEVEQRNYQLFLQDSYDDIRQAYLPKAQAELQKAEASDLLPISNIKPEKIAALFQEYAPKSKDNEYAFHAYQRIMYNAMHRGWGNAQGISNRAGDLLAVTFILYSPRRAMQLLRVVSPEGKSKGAATLMMDYFFRSHAGRPLVFDFNSDAIFAETLGAKSSPFLQLERQPKKWWQRLTS